MSWCNCFKISAGIFALCFILYLTSYKNFKPPVRKPVYLNIKLYNTDAVESSLPLAAKIGIGLGATALGIGGAIVGAPLILAGTGFTATGVAGGSFAAAWQSTIGNVFFGSTFAALQSVATAGLGYAGLVLTTAVGATAGTAVGVLIAGSVKKNVPLLDVEITFELFQTEQNLVAYNDIERMLTRLNLNLKGKELKNAYTKVTGRHYEDPVTYEEFLRLFGVKLLKGQELKDKLEYEFMEWIESDSPEREMTLEELEMMLKSLGVTVRRSDVEASFLSATNYSQERRKVSRPLFLKMCGFNQEKERKHNRE